jgi:hypothetical protein
MPNPTYRPLPRLLKIALMVTAGIGVLGAIALILVARSHGQAQPSARAINSVAVMVPLIITFFALMGLVQPWVRHRPDGTERRYLRFLGLLAPAAFYQVVMLSHAAAGGGSLLAGMLKAAPMTVFFLGFGVASLAVRKVGDEVSCAKCGYAMDAEIQAIDDPEQRCSECGAFWKRPGGFVRGRKQILKWPIAVAAILLVCGVGLMFSPFYRGLGARQFALLPTSSLIREVTATGSFTYDEWAVLSNRTLSQKQKLKLAEGLLAKRSKRQYLGNDEEAWFEAAVLNGELPRDIVERYFRGMLEVWIDAPDNATLGRPLSIGLGSDHRGSLRTPSRTTLKVYVIFAGFRVNGGELQEAATGPAHGISYGRVRRAWGKLERTITQGGTKPPELDIQPAAAGPLLISAEYWLVVAPPNAFANTSLWQPDGQPQIPPSAAWAERIIIDKTITIEP